MNIYVMRSSSR